MLNEVESNIIKRYDVKNRIGKGAYGIVWKAVDKKTGERVALKKIFDAFKNQTDAQRTFREIAFLQEFSGHPNIIKLLNIRKAENDRDIYLVFELMESDLHNVIKRDNLLQPVHKQYIIYQTLKALKYIHSGNVIHRDLKPSNILLDSNCMVKLCDFGLTRSLQQMERSGAKQSYNSSDDMNTDPTLTEYVATRWYRAPEILLGSTKYTKAVDLWSLGCILGELLLSHALFTGSSSLNQIEKIVSALPKPSDEDMASIKSEYCESVLSRIIYRPGKKLEQLFPANVDHEAFRLMKELLEFNPNKRLTVEEALNHDYIENFHDSESEVVIDHEVIPPINDDCQLTIEEYRSKLYDMIMQKKAERLARSNAKNETSERKGMQRTDPDYFSEHEQKSNSFNNNRSKYDVAFGRTTHSRPSYKTSYALNQSNSTLSALNQSLSKLENVRIESSKNVLRNSRGKDNGRNTPNYGKNNFSPENPTKKPTQPYVTTCSKEANNPVILRDLHTPTIAATGNKMSMQNRSSSAQQVRTNSTSYGRKQFDNAKNQATQNNLRSTFGSYSQTYGTITTSQIQNIINKNCVR